MKKTILKEYKDKTVKKGKSFDLLLVFGIFLLCIATIVITGAVANKHESAITENQVEKPSPEEAEQSLTLDTVQAKEPISMTEKSAADNHDVKEVPVSENTEENANATVPVPDPDPTFSLPIDGKVVKAYSGNQVVYSATMDDYRTHAGIDIACPFGTEVTAADGGTVEYVGNDINLGYMVILKHTNGFESVYCSLESNILVSVGQSVTKGEILGKTSDSCISEICDEAHLHFEIKKDGVAVNPLDLIVM